MARQQSHSMSQKKKADKKVDDLISRLRDQVQSENQQEFPRQ